MKVLHSVLFLNEGFVCEICSWIQFSWTNHHFSKNMAILQIVYIIQNIDLTYDFNFPRYVAPCIISWHHFDINLLKLQFDCILVYDICACYYSYNIIYHQIKDNSKLYSEVPYALSSISKRIKIIVYLQLDYHFKRMLLPIKFVGSYYHRSNSG